MIDGPDKPMTLDERIGQIRNETIRLGAMTCEAITAATKGFLAADITGAEEILFKDKSINALRDELEAHCHSLLARGAPLATDLRHTLAVLRIVHELERSADLMCSVAKATMRIFPYELSPKVRGIIDQMGVQAFTQTKVAVDAYAENDANKAAALAEMDELMDDLAKSLFTQILGSEGTGEGAIQRAVQLSLVARHYERTADHAVTIADRVVFILTGELPDH